MISSKASSTTWYMPKELYVLELTERFIFDKNSSEFRFIPIALTLFISYRMKQQRNHGTSCDFSI